MFHSAGGNENMPALRVVYQRKGHRELWRNTVVGQVPDALIGHTDVDAEIEKTLKFTNM